jgi:hypothetical protein
MKHVIVNVIAGFVKIQAIAIVAIREFSRFAIH